MQNLADTGNVARVKPESRERGNLKGTSGKARQARVGVWPAAVGRGAHGVFTSRRTLTGLRACGLPRDAVGFEVRSRRGFGFYAMARGFGYPVAHSRDLSEATAALLKLLAPGEIDQVRDARGKVIA